MLYIFQFSVTLIPFYSVFHLKCIFYVNVCMCMDLWMHVLEDMYAHAERPEVSVGCALPIALHLPGIISILSEKLFKKYFLHFFWRVSFQVYHCSFEDTKVFSSFSLFSLNICFFISAIWIYVDRQHLQRLIYFLNSVGYVSFRTFGATSGSFIVPLLCSVLLSLQWYHGYVNFLLVYL